MGFALLPFTRPIALAGGYDRAIIDRPDDVAAMLHRGVLETWKRTGTIPLTAYVFCRAHPESRIEGDCLIHMAMADPDAYESRTAKDLFSAIVRGIIHYGRARAVAFTMNAWVAKCDPDNPEHAGFDRGRSLEEHPERMDAIVAVFERPGQTVMWQAPLQHYGRRGLHIPPLREAFRGGGIEAGAFTGLFRNTACLRCGAALPREPSEPAFCDGCAGEIARGECEP